MRKTMLLTLLKEVARIVDEAKRRKTTTTQ